MNKNNSYSHPLDGSRGWGIRQKSHLPFYFPGAYHYVCYDKGKAHHFYNMKPITEDSLKMEKLIFRITLILLILAYVFAFGVVAFVFPTSDWIYVILGLVFLGGIYSIPLWIFSSWIKKDEKAYYLPGDPYMYAQDNCERCGGQYVCGIHNACPHCGGAWQ